MTHANNRRKSLKRGREVKANGSCLDQEIGALNREKNAVTHPVSQIPGYTTGGKGVERSTVGLGSQN